MKFGKEIKKLKENIRRTEDAALIEKQHKKGKLAARERIELLLDEGSFVELHPFIRSRFDRLGMDQKKIVGDGAITGFGRIKKRLVYVYSQDFSKIGGSLGEAQAEKIVDMIESARKTGSPIIGIIDSGGARIQEGIASLDGYAKIFRAMVKASGIIPQISVVVGPSAGGACYSPGLSDFVFMVEGISQMYITGPEIVKSVTNEKVNFNQLGGAGVHSKKSGCCDFVFQNEQDCFSGVKKLLSYLPQNNLENPYTEKGFFSDIFERENTDLIDILPDKDEKGYDIKRIIKEIFDRDSFFEVKEGFAQNIVVGFARIGGKTVGVVANQPKILAGCLDIDSSDKIAGFVRLCDSFNISLVNLIDTPGYLPGKEQEHQGIIRHGAKVLYAYAEATVPKVSLILRKAFGGAYIALCSRYLGYDRVIAWPMAQIAVMGAEQAAKIIYKKEIQASSNPARVEKERTKEYKEIFLNPWEAAGSGEIDLVIELKDTRKILIETLYALENKREIRFPRKHGNMPL